MSKNATAFICHHFFCLQNERNRISICGCVGTHEKTSGSVGVQGWNGEIGRWMVVGRFTNIIENFSTLGSFSEIDFGLSVASTGSSCRMHRFSYRMRNFKKNETKTWERIMVMG